MLRFFTLLTLGFYTLCLTSCLSPEKMLEKGQCRQAFSILIKKMEHPKAKYKWQSSLKEAYQCIQAEETRLVNLLLDQNDPEYLSRLVSAYAGLRDRQQMVSAYLPSLAQIDYQSAYLASSRQAAEYYFAEAEPYFTAARIGDKFAARKAYSDLGDAVYFDHQEWTPAQKTRLEMFDLGTLRIQVDLQSRTEDYQYYPGLAEGLRKAPVKVKRKDWIEVHWVPNGERIDFYAVPQIADLRVFPYCESEDCTEYEEEIKVGEREVEKTVTKGDSSWVEIEIVEIFETVYATVCEITQSRSARLQLDLILYDPENIVAQILPMDVSASWSNEYDVGSGDRRAMPACFGFRSSVPTEFTMEKMLARRLLHRLEKKALKAFP